MDIMTFRSYIEKMLRDQPKQVQEIAKYRIQLTLDLLGRETMSVEGLALIIGQVSYDVSQTHIKEQQCK
jgi:hypothetical protein